MASQAANALAQQLGISPDAAQALIDAGQAQAGGGGNAPVQLPISKNSLTQGLAQGIDQSNSGIDPSQNAFLNGFGMSTSTGNNALVYMGKTPIKRTPGVVTEDNGVRHGSSYTTVTGGDAINMPKSQALLQIYKDDNLRKQWSDSLVAAGYLSPTDAGDFAKVAKAWSDFVNEAANFTAAGNPKSPFDVLKLYNLKYAANQTVSKTTDTSTTQNYSQSDVEGRLKGIPGSAEGILQHMLGRNPTPQEVAAYQSKLNQASANNPQVQHEVATQDANGNIVRNVTVSGGVDPNQVLANLAEKDPEYGAYQAATTYMNALRQAAQGYI